MPILDYHIFGLLLGCTLFTPDIALHLIFMILGLVFQVYISYHILKNTQDTSLIALYCNALYLIIIPAKACTDQTVS